MRNGKWERSFVRISRAILQSITYVVSPKTIGANYVHYSNNYLQFVFNWSFLALSLASLMRTIANWLLDNLPIFNFNANQILLLLLLYRQNEQLFVLTECPLCLMDSFRLVSRKETVYHCESNKTCSSDTLYHWLWWYNTFICWQTKRIALAIEIGLVSLNRVAAIIPTICPLSLLWATYRDH